MNSEENKSMSSPGQTVDPVFDKYLTLIDNLVESSDRRQRATSQVSEKASMLQSSLLCEVKKLHNGLQSLSKAIPQLKRVVNKNGSLPTLPISMDSCQSMKNIIENSYDIFRTGEELKNSIPLSVENLNKAIKKKQEIANQINQRLSTLEAYCDTLNTLLDDIATLKNFQKLPDVEKFPEPQPDFEISQGNSSIQTIISEDVQASSSVLEESQPLDFENS